MCRDFGAVIADGQLCQVQSTAVFYVPYWILFAPSPEALLSSWVDVACNNLSPLVMSVPPCTSVASSVEVSANLSHCHALLGWSGLLVIHIDLSTVHTFCEVLHLLQWLFMVILLSVLFGLVAIAAVVFTDVFWHCYVILPIAFNNVLSRSLTRSLTMT